MEADADTCRQTDSMRLIGAFCDYGKAVNPLNAKLNPICHLLALLEAHPILHVSRVRVKKGYICFGRADFLHFQRRVKLTSLTLEFAVLPFSYSEDIIVDIVCIQGICRPYHSDPP